MSSWTFFGERVSFGGWVYRRAVISPCYVVVVSAGLSWDWFRNKATGQPRRW
jgi:hypothetical protein